MQVGRGRNYALRLVLCALLTFLFALAGRETQAASVWDLPPLTPTTAITRITVTFDRTALGDPGVFQAFGSFTTSFPFDGVQSNASWIVGHADPFTTDVTYKGTFHVTVNVDGAGNPVSGSILERVDYGSGLTTLFQSDTLLFFDRVTGTNQFRFSFLQESVGTWVQNSTTVFVPKHYFVNGVVFSGISAPDLATGLSFSNSTGAEAKVWVAIPTPMAGIGGGVLLAGLFCWGAIRRMSSGSCEVV